MSEGDFVNVRPHNAGEEGPEDIDESSDTYDTIDWLVRTCRATTARSACGDLVSRLLHRGGHDRRASRAQGGVAAGAGHRLVHRRRLPPQRRVLLCRTRSTSWRLRPAAAGADAQVADVRLQNADGYEFFLELGPLANVDKQVLQGRVAFWNELMEHRTYDEFWKARTPRPHLKNIKPAVMTVGGWFDAEDLFGALERLRGGRGARAPARRTCSSWAVGARRWCARRRRLARRRRSSTRRRPSSTASRSSCRSSSYLPQGQGRARSSPEAWVFETGTNQWRKLDAWPPQEATPKPLYFHAGGNGCRSRPPAGNSDARFDEYVSDPAKPVPFIGTIADRHDARATWSTTSASPPAARRAGLPDRRAGRGRDARRADRGRACRSRPPAPTRDWVVKLIDVYPDDFPDPEPEPARRADGRLPAAGARRRDARQVPQQLREAGAVRAGQADAGQVHAARRATTRSAAATGSWCRCRAPGSRWWTATRRSSWTSTRRRRATSRRRRSGCIDLGRGAADLGDPRTVRHQAWVSLHSDYPYPAILVILPLDGAFPDLTRPGRGWPGRRNLLAIEAAVLDENFGDVPAGVTLPAM